MKVPMIFAILLTVLLTSCTATAEEETAPPETEMVSGTTEPAAVSDVLRITEGGTHTLTGSYDGMVTVDAGAEDVTVRDLVAVCDFRGVCLRNAARVAIRDCGLFTSTVNVFAVSPVLYQMSYPSAPSTVFQDQRL